MKNNETIFIEIPEGTTKLFNEMAERYKTNPNHIIRALIYFGLNVINSEAGHLALVALIKGYEIDEQNEKGKEDDK